jgi:hypothetical protein
VAAAAEAIAASAAWLEDDDVFAVAAATYNATVTWTEDDDLWVVALTQAGVPASLLIAWTEEDDVWSTAVQPSSFLWALASHGAPRKALTHVRAPFANRGRFR